MKITEIVFVCFPVKSFNVSRKFYEGILGLMPTQNDWVKSDTSGFIEYNIGSGTLALGAGAPGMQPGKQGPSVALEVENFDESVAKIKENNVKFMMEPIDTGVCHMCVIEDPDGNALLIHKRK
jgi:predicted enzyme related to lactoylglutathione lyase